MPIKITPLLIGLFILSLVSLHCANASTVDDIYDAKIAVTDQSDRTQNQAFAKALKQVLLKVRGSSDLLAAPNIKSVVTKARRFVRSYRYDREGAQLFVVINFDPKRIDDLIRSAGFPIWDKRRPDTLVWLAIQPTKDAHKQIAHANEFSELYQQLIKRAQERGIKLIFPLWDLDDLQSLGVYDIWGGFSSQISRASERYAVQSVLSARIYPSDNLSQDTAVDSAQSDLNSSEFWVADWNTMESGSMLAGEVQGDSRLEVANSLVDTLADQLAQKYAIDLSQGVNSDAKVQLVINNIDSLTYYKQALALLENLSVVSSVTLIKQRGIDATFELQLLGDVEDLVRALNLDKKIRPVVDDFGQPIGELQFFWVK